ncbi:hypothetical protein [Pseudoruegeria sp. HB172150]|uniref:hypothetical protein n=1 Tax=Pseudoruegeria sp. HB172150 TaxID=2721164 RepID=UPI001556F0A8|nr:hypothetical protein [Pseudoruegeria sp. HB172150]
MTNEEWQKRLPLDRHGLAVLGAALHLSSQNQKPWRTWEGPSLYDLAYIGALDGSILEKGANVSIASFRFHWQHLYRFGVLVPWIIERVPDQGPEPPDRSLPIPASREVKVLEALTDLFLECARGLTPDFNGVPLPKLPVPRNFNLEWAFQCLTAPYCDASGNTRGREPYPDDKLLAASLAKAIQLAAKEHLSESIGPFRAVDMVLKHFEIQVPRENSDFQPYVIYSTTQSGSERSQVREMMKRVSDDEARACIRMEPLGHRETALAISLPFLILNSDVVEFASGSIASQLRRPMTLQ